MQLKFNEQLDFSQVIASYERRAAAISESQGMAIRQLAGDDLLNLSDVTLKQGQFYVHAAYAAIYSKISNQRLLMLRDLESIRDFYITEVILNQITEDVLAPKVGSDEVFRYSSKNEKHQQILDQLCKKQNLNQMIKNITPDLCFYGDYAVANKIDTERVDGKGKGIVAIRDNVDIMSVIPIRDGENLIGYLHKEEKTNNVVFTYPSDFTLFSLGGSRVKVDIGNHLPRFVRNESNKDLVDLLEKLPKYVRIGKSIFHRMSNKVRELELLERLIPATKISRLTQGNILSMNLPESYDLVKGISAADRFEQLLNRRVNVDPHSGEITAEAILTMAGRTRVLPTFGDKGAVSKFDTKNEDVDDITNTVTDLRSLILDSIGVPSELIYKSEDVSKNNNIRRSAKYIRKLKIIQKALADGLKLIAITHLINMGESVDMDEIEVVFTNALIELDNLDKLEFTQATITILKDVKAFFDDLLDENSPYKDSVDRNKLLEFLDENLKYVGLSDVIKTKKEGGKDLTSVPTPAPAASTDTSTPDETDSEFDDFPDDETELDAQTSKQFPDEDTE